MASNSADGDILDYSAEELDEILREVEKYEREELEESDIDFESDSEEQDKVESDPDDDVPLACLQTKWRPATHATTLADFTAPTGPNHNLPECAKPLEYFYLFLPQSFYDTLAEETNRYARQKIEAKGTPDPLWYPTTPAEMRGYMSILIMMGIKRQPRFWCYWSTDPRFVDPWISSVMPKTRFLKLNQYVHLRDTSNTPGRDSPQYDPLYKVRPFINLIAPLFEANFLPGRELSINEAMIGYKGRIFFKQYMPTKPTKWGIKVWEMCDADTGYCVAFDIYTGRYSCVNPEVSLGHDIVDKLAAPYYNQNRHLYFDRFFASPDLMSHLSRNGTYACATVMSNRKGVL